jgi:hypothetical protein
MGTQHNGLYGHTNIISNTDIQFQLAVIILSTWLVSLVSAQDIPKKLQQAEGGLAGTD